MSAIRRLLAVLVLAWSMAPVAGVAQEDLSVIVTLFASTDFATVENGQCTPPGDAIFQSLIARPTPYAPAIKHIVGDGDLVQGDQSPVPGEEGCVFEVHMLLPEAASYSFVYSDIDNDKELGSYSWEDLQAEPYILIDLGTFLGSAQPGPTLAPSPAPTLPPPTPEPTALTPIVDPQPTIGALEATIEAQGATIGTQESVIATQASIIATQESVIARSSATPAVSTPEMPGEGDDSASSEVGAFEVTIDVTASGYRVAEKLDDTTCRFGFPGLIANPNIVVLGANGEELGREPMGEGDWSMTGETAICEQTYKLSVFKSDQYTIQIAPYFTEEYSTETLQARPVEIELSRDEGDPFPLPVRPEGGLIEGTNRYRLVGTLELYGESGDEFMNLAVLGCFGLGGYDDIMSGAQITIRNESGDVVAVTELQPDPLSEATDECKFQFVAEVPHATFYSLEMGRRGDMTFSFDELEERGWFVELGIGP